MNANLLDPEALVAEHSLPEPIYFPSGERRLFGWLHRPAEPLAQLGVVICAPFGYEAVCSHRSLRAFADAVVGAGLPTLRFDYAGTGDSEDAASDADQIALWRADIVAAVATLQRATGVSRVCLLGVRLGALLAALAAGECASITSLIAIAPVVSGRRYVRELRTFQASVMVADAGSAAAPGLEVTGFALSAATVATLSTLDLTTLSGAPARQALVIDRADLPQARAWADTLLRGEVQLSYLTLPGYVEMVSTPHAAVPPQPMIEASIDWLRGINPTRAGPILEVVGADGGMAGEIGRARFPATLTLRMQAGESELTEHALYFSSDPTLFGVVTQPARGEIRRRGVIMLNGGATYRIGPNRMHVSLARRWAQHGYVVLRLDLAGLGDSATRPGRPPNEVYPPAAVDDIRTAIEYLRRSYHVGDLTLVGLCAGAYHSLRAATARLPVNRILMINPLTFFWKQGMTPNDLQVAEVVRNPGVYRERLVSVKSWKKLLTGKVNVWRIVQVIFQRLWLSVESALRDLARSLRVRLPQDLGWELEEVAARGVRMVFVFAKHDTGVDLLKIQAGSSVKRLRERCHMHLIDGADHIFSQRAPRTLLQEILSAELFARPDR